MALLAVFVQTGTCSLSPLTVFRLWGTCSARRHCRRGFFFILLCVYLSHCLPLWRGFLLAGQSGLGKSTLMNTLFKSKVSRKSVMAMAQEKIPKTIEIKSISHGMTLLNPSTLLCSFFFGCFLSVCVCRSVSQNTPISCSAAVFFFSSLLYLHFSLRQPS